MTGKWLMPYPEGRALEDAAYARGERPTRIYRLLLPVWRVEIQATVTEAEPYDLIDYYLERGIRDCALDTPAELADFFSLDETLVDRALRVLARIGHVREDGGGRVALTEIGVRSVQDRWRYTVESRDRRELYFDGLGSQPLPRAYYDPSTVTLLAGEDLTDVVNRRTGPAFRPVVSQRMFRDEALVELAARRDRDRFNLPARIDAPERVAPPVPVYLPAYLVRTVAPGGRPRLLAYTQAGDTADEDVTRMYGGPDLAALIENEESAARDGRDETRARDWLRGRGLDAVAPRRQPDGMLRVNLPASAFDGSDPVPLHKLGSFVVGGTDFFHVWCEDVRVRRRALLYRIESYARPNIRRADLDQRIAKIGRQVGLGEVDFAELRRMAARARKRDLVCLLDDIGERS
ncbi:hypothetical protein [Actinomadura luteofluorescens]|uniref:hypothetical protein n=1 Tax=Actinomadura luteofluorescens TaxID=46163 RepID=UPI0030CC905E